MNLINPFSETTGILPQYPMAMTFTVNIYFSPLHDHWIAVRTFCQDAKTELKPNLSE